MKRQLRYHSFGMLMHERSYSSPAYRYGFNGIEKNDEFYGEGNEYNSEYRQFDVRLGRWLSIEPRAKELPFQSTYSSNNNNPILYKDPKGDFGLLGALAGAVAGAIGDLGYQAYKNYKDGKPLLSNIDWQEVGATALGGAIALGTFGVGTAAVGALGGSVAIGGAASAMIQVGSAIVGGVVGNFVKQGVNMIGRKDKNFDGMEVLYSGAFAVFDIFGGKALDQVITNGGKGALKMVEQYEKNQLKKLREEIIDEAVENGLNKRKATRAADKAIKSLEKASKEGFEPTGLFIKITTGGTKVVVSTVQAGALEKVQDSVKENDKKKNQ